MSSGPVNILYIHSHDTGRYIQPYGYAVPTPNLQRFAEEGVLFRQAFCAAPTCSPSRAALLTGTTAHSSGMLGLAGKRGSRLRDPQEHLANFLKSHGYATALSGLQHVTGDELEQIRGCGYERWITHEAWPSWANHFEAWNTWHAEAAATFLDETPADRPFFLDCGFSLTHRMGEGEQWHTMRQPPDGDSRYVRPPAPLPDTPETRQDYADYMVAAGLLDECVGHILTALDESGKAANTLVIITTDHGLASPSMKCNLTAHGTGVMLLIRGPGGFSGGRVIDAPVSHLSVFPTICEVAGLPKPARLQGESLAPIIGDKLSSVGSEVFSEVNWHSSAEPMRSVRTERYNYIRRYLPREHAAINCDNSVSRRLMIEAGWHAGPGDAEELYDLMLDPQEMYNRAGDPAMLPVLEDMRLRLHGWMERTDDPILKGRIDPWPEMVVNAVFGMDKGGLKPAEPVIIPR